MSKPHKQYVYQINTNYKLEKGGASNERKPTMLAKTAKPASNPIGQLLGLGFVTAALFIAVNPSASISQSVHRTLGNATIADSTLVSSIINANNPVYHCKPKRGLQ